jgi:protein SCO1/2
MTAMRISTAVLLMLWVCITHAQQSPPPVGIVEKLGAHVPLDVELYDEGGNIITLQSLMTKPTIFTFVYYRCPGICSPLLTEVSKVIQKMDLLPGRDYQVVTLSFDHTEKPELAAEKKQSYLHEMNQSIDPNGWRFLTGDSANIFRLTSGAGFYFQRSGKDWIHAATLIAVSPDGKVTRYLYGIDHLPFDVKMAVLEASEGRPSPTIAKVLRFCYAYDPEGRTYALNFTRIGAIVVLGLVAIFVGVFVIRPKRRTPER